MDNVSELEKISKESFNYIKNNKMFSQVLGNSEHKDHWIVDRGIRGYGSIFSSNHEVDFEEFIVSKVKKLKESEKFVIFDVGCGAGIFLKQAEDLDLRIRGYGITNVLFEGHDWNRIIVGDISSSKYDSSNGLYSLPDIPYMLPSIPDNSADLIVSAYTLMYVSEPEVKKVVEHAGRILKKGGTAFLDLRDIHARSWVRKENLNQFYVEGCSISPIYFRATPNSVKALRLDKL